MTVPKEISPDKWSERLIDRLAYAHDASMYRLVPQAVARPKSEQDVQSILNYANDAKMPVTFRTGGTSLSGQSITEGIIAEVVQGWQDYDVLDGGRSIRLSPGVIGAKANLYLSPYQKRIGPDPASINIARIGGIISNNSSGMVCGVKHNAYHTMKYIRFMLANGKVYDTRNQNDYERFVIEEYELAEGILSCKKEVESNQDMVNKIKNKYRIKNTLGYSLNALIDYNHPLDIFAHLIIGAEGTLAFFSSVELETIDDPPLKSTGLVLFNSVEEAVSALSILVDEGADAIELLDDASLRTARYVKNAPYDYRDIQDQSAGLLFEFQKWDGSSIASLNQTIPGALKSAGGELPLGLTDDIKSRTDLWNIRKGLYPTVGAMRKKGTSVITEDLCYDFWDLPKVVKELKSICQVWQYDDAVIFGHAKDGNLHFAASMDLNTNDGASRFEGLLDEMADLTVGKFNGSLKAEHGTGRNMAPFVEYEWGGDLYKIMWKIKSLADPNHIMNPDVLLTKDDKLHVKNLKKMPIVSDEVDLCVECGFCEPVCPSKALTMTPRQRIVIQREISMGNADASVLKDYNYDGIDTCATDGLCEMACPVNINTGSYIKSLREEKHSNLANKASEWASNNFAFVQSLARLGLKVGKRVETFFGIKFMMIVSNGMHALFGTPKWHVEMPHAAPTINNQNSDYDSKWVYYPSCLSRIFCGDNSKSSLMQVVQDIGKKMKHTLIIPDGIQSTCCSQPFASKGFADSAASIQSKTIDFLWQVSEHGSLPIMVDTSPCTYQFLHANSNLSESAKSKLDQLKIIDLIDYLSKYIGTVELPKLKKEIALHPTCSTEKMGHTSSMEVIAESCAEKITRPIHWGCCGFAGDKGMNTPELNQSAVRQELSDLGEISEGYSTSRTCEMGMSQSDDLQYRSLAYLALEYLSQPVN